MDKAGYINSARCGKTSAGKCIANYAAKVEVERVERGIRPGDGEGGDSVAELFNGRREDSGKELVSYREKSTLKTILNGEW